MKDDETLDRVAGETGFSIGAVRAMRDAMVEGGGSMAQFAHAEFGGSGQWMRGGMLMTGDPFDHALKARIEALTRALDAAGALDVLPASRAAAAPWWPGAFGRPDSSGAQDTMRYAYFAGPRRLAIDDGRGVAVYDTGDHRIGGVAQQQGGSRSLTFTSQHGPVALESLRRIDAPEPAPPRASTGSAHATFDALERLADLHARGVLTDDEYGAKKSDLLARI